jgi:hypothetical protein
MWTGLDFNELLIEHPAATFAIRIEGESYTFARNADRRSTPRRRDIRTPSTLKLDASMIRHSCGRRIRTGRTRWFLGLLLAKGWSAFPRDAPDRSARHGPQPSLGQALRLRCVGAQNVDVERVQRAPELGQALTLDCPGAIDPKDAVLVAVERDRLAMRLEILAGRLEVVEG